LGFEFEFEFEGGGLLLDCDLDLEKLARVGAIGLFAAGGMDWAAFLRIASFASRRARCFLFFDIMARLNRVSWLGIICV